MTYKQALAKGSKDGWAHTEGEPIEAARAQFLALKHCLRPDAVFKWHQKLDVSLSENFDLLYGTSGLLLVCVLNDWNIEQGLDEL